MRKTHAIVGLLFTAMVLLAVPAYAEPPERLLPPEPIAASFVVDNCGFDVLVELEGKEGLIFFADHLRLIAPGQKATLTNLENGNSTTVNISGPGTDTIVENPDGGFTGTLVGTGNWIGFLDADIVHISGYFVDTIVVDADGNLVSQEIDLSRARVVSLCDAVA
jgi:hypothetical protein